ncbi:nucleotide sugar dehydrogenase [Cupriavidus sp. DL-D2]|jgi:UDP-N-acetyl-D-galactosamine dehydrogenase|uniref:nucleotide sugar dehydrogenase n=1 Tax=Cupriavidus sp. DL-D2 TaxID=3144974 RepID=UPI0032140229
MPNSLQETEAGSASLSSPAPQIVVVGLGYVGAPLAVELSRHFCVIGFDINEARVQELGVGKDRNNEITRKDLQETKLSFSSDASVLAEADIIVVTVPTPVDAARVPDLNPVIQASKTVGHFLKQGAIVVYESTVYPGVTEEICVPLLEQHSGLKHLKDFHVGYSPERISPGDRENTLTTVTKIVSGDTPKTREVLGNVYGAITKVYLAQSIKVAEAAKVLENTQRDVNIALMNEVSQLLSSLGVDTHDVLAAARTKWNFLDFRPGLVGGHCISVDPYYLTHKAASCGFTANLVLAARETNDGMAQFVVNQLIRAMTQHHLLGPETIITVLGTTFKENVPDIRNSKVADIIRKLSAMGIRSQVVDMWADSREVEEEYGYRLTQISDAKPADAIVLAVPHIDFRKDGWALIESLAKPNGKFVVSDLKAVLNRGACPARAILWRP